jgi:FtsP/CotA-like multicopper oxidase with cupredoxin domain
MSARVTSYYIAIIALLAVTVSAGILPEPPRASAPVTLAASSDPVSVYATFPPTVLKRVEASEPQFVVNFTEDKQGFYINGKKFEMDSGPMLTVDVDSLQHWRVTNTTREVHPFHIHQVHFLAYAVDGNPVKDPVWLDTVNVPYGSSVDLVMDFTDPIIRGMSLFHCHLLNHEDKGMMAKILFR